MMMSKHRAKSSKPKKSKQEKELPKLHPLRKYVGYFLAFVGLLASALSLLPRLDIQIADPVKSDDPLSAAVTVTNTGYIPLFHVLPSIGLGEPGGTPTYWPRWVRAQWPVRTLWPGDKFTFPLDDVWNTDHDNLPFTDIAIVIGYQPLIPHFWNREKLFPIEAVKQGDGHFRWHHKTIMEQPQNLPDWFKKSMKR